MTCNDQILSGIPKNVVDAAASIRLVVIDADGVLTDGTLYFNSNGELLKAFNIHDGLGIKLLEKSGIPVGIITGRFSDPLVARAKELGISFVVQGREDKLTALEEIRLQDPIEMQEICYVGDDLPDIAAIRKVGLGICVANCNSVITSFADWQTTTRGGSGAVREVADMILAAQGKLASILADHL